MQPLLRVNSLSKTFGGLRAFSEISFQIFPHQIVGIIGPNGAGKTSLFNTLSGIYKPNSGQIYFLEEEITGLSPHEICRKGIARTFQNLRLFSEMTVLENVLTGFVLHDQTLWHQILFRSKMFHHNQKEIREKGFDLLRQVGLEKHSDIFARNLPYGHQRKLEIARALATGAKLLLLDEPGAGMNATEILELIEVIRNFRNQGISILLIEHHMKVVMELCDHVVVLDHGEELACGTPSQIASHPEVISAYLGEALGTNH